MKPTLYFVILYMCVRFYNPAAIVVAMNKIIKETYNVKKYTRTSARIVNQ